MNTSNIYMGHIYDLVVFKIILSSFIAFLSKYPVSRKWLVVECNGVKFETQGE